MNAIVLVLFSLTAADSALAPEAAPLPERDRAYVEEFAEHWRQTFDSTADPAWFDAQFLDAYFGVRLLDPELNNDDGLLAWTVSPYVMSLNLMARTTGEPRYFDFAHRSIQRLLEVRDDRRGVALYTGREAVGWSATKYAEAGRSLHAVHTGMITQPIFGLLRLADETPAFRERLGDDYDVFLQAAEATLAEHDRQWREGPEPAAGHYVGLEQEDKVNGRPLPINRQAAMAWAMLEAWRVTGKEVYRDRAARIGHYFKNRLTLGENDAYYWPFWLPEEPVPAGTREVDFVGEDTSHASVTIQLPIALHAEGLVFTGQDMRRFARTFTHSVARLGGGVVLPRVTGEARYSPRHTSAVARWLPFAEHDPAVGPLIEETYVNYRRSISAHDLALLIAYAERTGDEPGAGDAAASAPPESVDEP